MSDFRNLNSLTDAFVSKLVNQKGSKFHEKYFMRRTLLGEKRELIKNA
jgi:hypothetical protein